MGNPLWYASALLSALTFWLGSNKLGFCVPNDLLQPVQSWLRSSKRIWTMLFFTLNLLNDQSYSKSFKNQTEQSILLNVKKYSFLYLRILKEQLLCPDLVVFCIQKAKSSFQLTWNPGVYQRGNSISLLRLRFQSSLEGKEGRLKRHVAWATSQFLSNQQSSNGSSQPVILLAAFCQKHWHRCNVSPGQITEQESCSRSSPFFSWKMVLCVCT